MILVSACLAGFCCTYKGESKELSSVVKLVREGRAIPVCPEQLGGLTTPRTASECRIEGGEVKVYMKDKRDVTDKFYRGAEETLKLAKMYGCNKAILKEKSPSCGTVRYDGSFSGNLMDEMGITAMILNENGIEVISSDDKDMIEEITKYN